MSHGAEMTEGEDDSSAAAVPAAAASAAPHSSGHQDDPLPPHETGQKLFHTHLKFQELSMID